ncbi:MAG: hypothetical protein Q8P88_03155 [Candidatus Jorgensenbacteria bacterium]|nr:hypothetical protein [Candidatus Jorgensenbacteria bacterium]
MEIAILIFVSLIFLVQIVIFVGSKGAWTDLWQILSEIKESMSQIAESKRLSTILTVEAKKGLDITPEEFEPKREELRKNLHQVLDERLESKKGKIDDPDTWAFVILNHAGFDLFVDSNVRAKAQNALGRLLANNNVPAAKRFLTTLARNL